MDIKKLPPIINAAGVLIMVLWGTLANDWEHSWIAVCVCGFISGLVYYYSKTAANKRNRSR